MGLSMGVFSRKKDQTESFPQSPARASRSRTTTGGDEAELDPTEIVRRRARRRLIGAIALAVGAVVFLPMIFESEPGSPTPTLSVQMPDKDTPFVPGVPAQEPREAPAAASNAGSNPGPNPGQNAAASSPVPGALMSTNPAENSAPGTGALAAPGTSSASTSAPAAGEPSAPAGPNNGAKPRPPAAADKEAAAHPAAKAAEKDDPRALAALEGRVLDPTSGKGAGSFAVQIGAFSSSEKVKDLREKLGAAGLKSYTETLNTAQGERTRVRVGPYPSHEAAEKARERVKGVGLDGAVIPL
jgi:DedD protein